MLVLYAEWTVTKTPNWMRAHSRWSRRDRSILDLEQRQLNKQKPLLWLNVLTASLCAYIPLREVLHSIHFDLGLELTQQGQLNNL